ncbi:MAG: prevent-host-death protein [Oscillospiraceae bacterium]|nr:prevent-host-death protein [Oscillospiraceae bacterium]
MERIVKNHGHAVFTDNGHVEAVIIGGNEYETYKEHLHALYVREKLAEVEVKADNPATWTPWEDFDAELDEYITALENKSL